MLFSAKSPEHPLILIILFKTKKLLPSEENRSYYN